MPDIAMGKDVFDWPEFQALIKRLGLDTPPYLQQMIIDVSFDDAVKITTVELGEDHG